MTYNPAIHHRRSIRLQGYDYSQNGAYYITLDTLNHEWRFGEIVDGKMILNDAGECAQSCWIDIPVHFPDVELDVYVIMPNHVHGIIVIRKDVSVVNSVGVQNFEPRREPKINQYQHIIPRSIGSIIRGYKTGVTKWFRQNTEIHTVWQRDYGVYPEQGRREHIIRNEQSLHRIREYIVNNPMKWEMDKNNSGRANICAPTREII